MHETTDLNIYLVGGAVRDSLLGLPVAERDWVVVGADAAAMRARGFVAADRDFPVFLHPESGEEYALARREVKRGEGYRGFEVYAGPDVTLEEDLQRRDLTVNAIAQDAAGNIIDPYGGCDDLDGRLLRHVSPAFVEDPLRVLRTARFAARLGQYGFHLSHATYQLMRQVVNEGGMQQLAAERLWREMSGAMRSGEPWRFFEVLHGCGALRNLIAPLAAAMGRAPRGHAGQPDSLPVAALKRVSRHASEPSIRLAATLMSCIDSADQVEELGRSLRADRATTQLLKRAVSGRSAYLRAEQGEPDALFELARTWRGFDTGADIEAPLAVCEAQSADPVVGNLLQHALPAARAVSVEALRSEGVNGAELGHRIGQARRAAMAAALRQAAP